MSGLFTRLARQAAGKPRNQVHPAMPMRFQTASETLPQAPSYPVSNPVAQRFVNNQPDGRNDSSSPGREDRPIDRIAANPAATVPAGETPVRPKETAINFDLADRSALSPALDDANASTTPQSNASVLSESSAVSSNPDGKESHEIFMQTEPVDSSLTSAEGADQANRWFTSEQPELAMNVYQQSSRPDSAEQAADTPAALLPSIAGPASVDSAAAARVPPISTESPNEVHVHIGRIEVTALAEPARPQPQPRATREPMSLDDYLARRSQDRS